MKKRSTCYDITGGILICWMILYHIFQYSSLTENEIYLTLRNVFCFFMPYFFYKSGMFFNKERDLKIEIKHGLDKLIVPFFVFSIIGQLQLICTTVFFNDVDSSYIRLLLSPFKSLLLYGAVPGNLALWFLPILFCSKYLYKKFSVKPYSLSLICFLLGGGYCYIGIDYFCWIITPLLGCLFYSIGYLMKELQFKKIIFLGALITYVIIICFFPSFVDFRTITIIEGSYILWCIASIAGCIIINNIIKILLDYIGVLLEPFRYIGENAMSFYCIHWIILNIIKFICQKNGIHTNIHLFIILLLSCVLLLPILNKIIKHYSLKTLIGLSG